jgi:Tfp pilus assembly protein PilF
LLKRKQPGTSLLLAWQLWQLGEQQLADEVYNNAMAAAGADSSLMLLGIDYLWQTNQLARADALLQKLLADERLAQRAAMWRLGAALAQRRGLTGRYVAYVEKAMDLEFKNLPNAVNLQTVRQDYSGLLQHYQQLAVALTMLETEPSKEFMAKVVRAADRWRALDHDSTSACQQASKILQTLGARDLAWDYLTTPIGLRPNEAAPWVSLAQNLRGEADYELADRAYATAFQAEPTNAQILWDRAQNLQQLGRPDQARQLYRQLADGTWQPRFQGLQNQARAYLVHN